MSLLPAASISSRDKAISPLIYHDIDEFNEIERFIVSDDPLGLGEYINGGYAVSGKDGTYEEGEYTYSPKITYLARYFAPADRDYIIRSMVEFYQKGNRALNCSVSEPCYDPDRKMQYYNIIITAVSAHDSSSHAVLQARMFYDYTGIYQPEVYSVAPGGCSAELLSDLRNFFGCELDTPVLSSKNDDLTEAKKLLDDNGIRCKNAVGTSVGTGEQEYNLLTSFDDAAKASGIMMSNYGDNSGYECYTY